MEDIYLYFDKQQHYDNTILSIRWLPSGGEQGGQIIEPLRVFFTPTSHPFP